MSDAVRGAQDKRDAASTPVGRPGVRMLSDLAAHVGGQVFGDLEITGVADPREAGPADLVFLLEPKYQEAVLASPAGAVVAKAQLQSAKPQIVVANPRLYAPNCHSPEQMRLANALCRYRELATELRHG